MKTKITILIISLAGLMLVGCSSSKQLSKADKHQGDDLYYSSSEKVAAEQNGSSSNNGSKLDLVELEKKYSDILANDKTGEVDTLIYKDENPYERVLSDSYYDSYQRRIDARREGYGSNFIHNYDDYWYARAYDPSYYNIIVYGDHMWVEPHYISAMFSWPRYRYSHYGYFSYNSGYWGHSPWSYGMHWGIGYPYHWGYYGFGYSGWNSYAWGYNAGYWDGYYGGNQAYAPNHSYGVRPVSGNTAYGVNPGVFASESVNINETQNYLSSKQPTFQSKPTRDDNSLAQEPTRKPIGHEVSRNPSRKPTLTEAQDLQYQVREPVRDPNAITRPSRENVSVNPTRVISPENDRRPNDYSPSYTRPQPGNSNEFNRPNRNYPSTEAVRGARDNQQVAPPRRDNSRQSTRTYNPPSRVNTPASTPPKSNDRGSSGTISRPSGSSSSSGTTAAPTRSSSGSSSSGSSDNTRSRNK